MAQSPEPDIIRTLETQIQLQLLRIARLSTEQAKKLELYAIAAKLAEKGAVGKSFVEVEIKQACVFFQTGKENDLTLKIVSFLKNIIIILKGIPPIRTPLVNLS